jgi:hypothetical protein
VGSKFYAPAEGRSAYNPMKYEDPDQASDSNEYGQEEEFKPPEPFVE